MGGGQLAGSCYAVSVCRPVLANRFARLSAIVPLVAVIGLWLDSAAQGQVSVDLNSHGDVVVSGLETRQLIVLGKEPDLLSRALQVRLRSNASSAVGLLGKTEVVGSQLFFRPRFPLVPGRVYDVRLQYNVAGHDIRLDGSVQIPQSGARPPRVTQVFPSGDRLPENLLKFYVHFSKPMRPGDIYRYVRLVDQSDQPVELPFLEIEQELWSRDGKRLTLLLDPGRIKRGLKPRKEMGPIFEVGGSYRLVIDGDWPDADGIKLGEDFVKTFRVSLPDESSPSVQAWQKEYPQLPNDPLRIKFDEPLDHSMLNRVITITDDQNREVAGRIRISHNESVWKFTPAEAWQPGNYRVQVSVELEDRSGNNLKRQFDVDTFDKVDRQVKSEKIVWSFSIN